MSEQPQSIQPPDQPLDPHTLRVADDVLYALARNTPAGERYEGLMMAHNELRSLLAKANPRARVVVLPEPCGSDDDGQVYYDDHDIRVDTTGSAAFPNTVWYRGIEYTPKHAYALGLELVAAGIAGGAQ